MFTERLINIDSDGLSFSQRIESLKLLEPSRQQLQELNRFLRASSTKPLLSALYDLSDKQALWIGSLNIEGASEDILGIEILPFRTTGGRVARWTGLTEVPDGQGPPELILNPDADQTGDYSKLEIRWKAIPDHLAEGSVDYQVRLETDLDEELISQLVSHSARSYERTRFTDDDFSILGEDVVISAKVVLSVIGKDDIAPQESEEFIIRYGQTPDGPSGGVGRKIRTFSEGLIELDDRESVTTLLSTPNIISTSNQGFLQFRSPEHGKSYQVFQPPLIREIEEKWANAFQGAIGRWRLRIRASGTPAGQSEFVAFHPPEDSNEQNLSQIWDRARNSSQRLAQYFGNHGGGLGQIYDEELKTQESITREYMLAWAALLEIGDPSLALANTIEVQSLSGQTIGLIVLPSHPLRVAWHTAYDNLVLHTAFENKVSPKDITEEFRNLDGAMFPALLPGLEQGTPFVFADTLGFHSVGMVLDTDKEPKASIALLNQALGGTSSGEMPETQSIQSTEILGDEIIKYINCHEMSKSIHIHALRSGDGSTVARSLGKVQKQWRENEDDESADEPESHAGPSFVLELYPSLEQRGLEGRFISDAREKRRRGAGVLATEDHWMLESVSLPNGANLPRLRWARKEQQDPETPAHLALAFNTFDSNVVTGEEYQLPKAKPPLVYGLISMFERTYSNNPAPSWRSFLLPSSEGDKHPSDRTHTDRLVRLQQIIQRSVAKSIDSQETIPVLRTDISAEKSSHLRQLHKLCDWVVTLDRNAGVEYFDSPTDNRDVYETYVIDTVPEREDLGNLQMITSTSNLSEVRNLLDDSLDQMGLSRSRRNAEFLMDHLKSLSGRLAIRLTGRNTGTSELIGLAMSQANCERASSHDDCWTSLQQGFFIPVDDVLDLIPPLTKKSQTNEASSNSMVRPDLIYVTMVPRRGLSFRFIEVKYRQDLAAARSSHLMEVIREQVGSMHKRWDEWYGKDNVASALRSIRRAKLSRVLRFYADKAHRHHLPTERYNNLVDEIDRMTARGEAYAFDSSDYSDRGWIFCPEYAGTKPEPISPPDWETEIFLFGPGLLPHGLIPDLNMSDGITSSPVEAETAEEPSTPATVITNSEEVLNVKRISVHQ